MTRRESAGGWRLERRRWIDLKKPRSRGAGGVAALHESALGIDKIFACACVKLMSISPTPGILAALPHPSAFEYCLPGGSKTANIAMAWRIDFNEQELA
jgi:hypothetical protein